MDELSLVRAVLRGETDALDRFAAYVLFVSTVLHARNVHAGSPFDPHELEDVVQETLVAIWRKLPGYDGRASLRTWVFGFCSYEFLRCLRDKASRSASPSERRADEPAALEHEASRMEHALRLGLERLRARERKLLFLKHFEGRTFDAIGAELGLPVNTVKSRYYRALDRLRRIVGKSLEVGE